MEKEWIGKKIYVRLNSGRIYTGEVLEISNNLITITDKFGALVSFSANEINFMKEEV